MKCNKTHQIFISYSSQNRRRVERLVRLLRLHGVAVWYDEWQILVGHNILDEVYAGVLGSEYLGVAITNASLNSRWVKEELSIARQRELDDNEVVILPLLFDKVELPIHLKQKKYADFRSFEKGFTELLRIMNVPALNSLPTIAEFEQIRKAIVSSGQQNRSNLVRTVSSVAESRLAIDYAIVPKSVDEIRKYDVATSPRMDNTITVKIHLDTINQTLPLRASPDQTVESLLRLIEQIVDFPKRFGDADSARETERTRFFLLHKGYPLELRDTLRDAGITDQSVLKIGCFLFAIE